MSNIPENPAQVVVRRGMAVTNFHFRSDEDARTFAEAASLIVRARVSLIPEGTDRWDAEQLDERHEAAILVSDDGDHGPIKKVALKKEVTQ